MFKLLLRVALPAPKVGALGEGPWRSARTPGINQALSNDYLKSEGLYSLRDGWIKLHYPK
jgi:RNA-directed DNA polymerase